MMKSMTGYGSAIFTSGEVDIEIQVKSVNGRFLDLRFHLPKEYFPAEIEMKKLAACQLGRGSVDVFIHRRLKGDSKLFPISVRTKQAKAWWEALSKVRKDLKIKEPVTLQNLLSLPHIFEVQESTGLSATERKGLLQTFEKAVGACAKMRAQEGDRLRQELSGLIKELQALVTQLKSWREGAEKRISDRLEERLSQLTQENLDPHRLALETALLVDKMDVKEELVRLGEHLKVCHELIKAKEAQGKKLDFYAQELLREVNTIGSKVQLAEMTEVVVQAKAVIESFREQVQNIQ